MGPLGGPKPPIFAKNDPFRHFGPLPNGVWEGGFRQNPKKGPFFVKKVVFLAKNRAKSAFFGIFGLQNTVRIGTLGVQKPLFSPIFAKKVEKRQKCLF